jgi:hypothetical protein
MYLGTMSNLFLGTTTTPTIMSINDGNGGQINSNLKLVGNFYINQSAISTTITDNQLGYTGYKFLSLTNITSANLTTFMTFELNKGVWFISLSHKWYAQSGNNIQNKELLISETSTSIVGGGTVPINGGFHYYDEIDDDPGSAGTRQILSMSGIYVATSDNKSLFVNIKAAVGGVSPYTAGYQLQVSLNLTYTRIA